MSQNTIDRANLEEMKMNGSISEFEYELQLALLEMESLGFIERVDENEDVHEATQ